MKTKITLSLFLVFVLASFVSAICTDSDANEEYPNGINPYENGEIYFKSQYAQDWQDGMYTYDSCSNGILYESYCSEDGNTIETEEIECPTGYKCWIDKCILDDEEYTPDIEGDGESPSGGGGGGSVSNNTAPSGSGSGGGSCSKYYTCNDGTQVNYCSRIREEIPITCVNSTTSGAGQRCTGGSVSIKCVCEENPESLCPSTSPSNSSSGGGSSNGSVSNNTAPSGSGSGGGSSSCLTGCNLNGSCVSFGYRINNTYCDLNKSFVPQKQEDSVCENNWECSSNVCVSGKCIDEGFIQKILNWFKRLFGGN